MSLTACTEISERSASSCGGWDSAQFSFSGNDYGCVPFYPNIKLAEIPIYRVATGNKTLIARGGLKVRFEPAEDGFIASNDNLNIYAFGVKREDALQDFKEQLAHFYYHYRDKKTNELTGLAKRLKKLYDNSFSEVPG